jgi:hypothetical protein
LAEELTPKRVEAMEAGADRPERPLEQQQDRRTAGRPSSTVQKATTGRRVWTGVVTLVVAFVGLQLLGISAFLTDPCSDLWRGTGFRAQGIRCREVLEPAELRYSGMGIGYLGALTGFLLIPFGIYYVAAGRRPKGYRLLLGTTLSLAVLLFFVLAGV